MTGMDLSEKLNEELDGYEEYLDLAMIETDEQKALWFYAMAKDEFEHADVMRKMMHEHGLEMTEEQKERWCKAVREVRNIYK